MGEDPRTNKYERQLKAIPTEFRELATWAWLELRPRIEIFGQSHGLGPIEASHMAARIARLVVTQMYGDISRGRRVPIVSRS